MDRNVIIDGSQGEGGGQILRSALALSLATGTPFRMEKIRAGRRKSGLLRQHLTCVRLAARVGDAFAEGMDLGSKTLAFAPQACRPGTYEVQVGTAGSTSLVAQSVLPALLFADGPTELVIEGGTHARSAPPYDFLEQAWAPVMRTLGASISMAIERHGFFPAGGGRVRIRVEPTSSPRALELRERGERVGTHAKAIVARIPGDVAERELAVVAKQMGWPSSSLHVDAVRDTAGPGNALVLRIEHEHVTEVFTAFGSVGLPAERVAKLACADARSWLKGTAPVGTMLADQLMVPLALGAGGTYRTTALSRHSRTNLEVLMMFLGDICQVHPLEDGGVDVHIRGLLG